MLDFKTSDQRIKGVASKLTKFDGKEISLALARAKATKKIKEAYTLDEKKISQLRKYIHKRSKKGASGREIISDLVNEGWDQEVIKMFVMAYC